jgi:predicted nucleic acid-binding protein
VIEVIDASVVAKWFLREGEPGLTAADAVLHRVVEQPDRVVVPALLQYELIATLCRRLLRPADVQNCLERFRALGVPVVDLDATLTRLTTEIAFAHRLTGYDAVYVAVAIHLKGVWLTFDRAAYRRVARLGVAHLLPAK